MFFRSAVGLYVKLLNGQRIFVLSYDGFILEYTCRLNASAPASCHGDVAVRRDNVLPKHQLGQHVWLHWKDTADDAGVDAAFLSLSHDLL
jgi:hypothetical protein